MILRMKTQIFVPGLFDDCNLDSKIEIYNFGKNNNIKLLCDTIIYCLKTDITECLIADKTKNLIVGCDKPHFEHLIDKLKSNDELVEKIKKLKISDYEPENNYRDLFISRFRYFDSTYYKCNKEIPGNIFQKLYKIWKSNGLKFFECERFKEISDVLGLKPVIYEFDAHNAPIDMDDNKPINKKIEFKDFALEQINETFLEFLTPFRDWYSMFNDIEIEILNDFIYNF